ncbi:MAG: hypothetical protein A2624_05950 [Gammaproteobacteria bacterium RIFCSPHIGHO2_01_FULL_42_8]|nr:MAG: hypothetical protein A2624_05950 [Gammaproteobacteria bacterium RIFCSPHIGHO2_01_FULL_42_8]
MLLNAMIEAYSFFRARYKLTMQDDQYNLYTEYLLKHRKTCNFDDAQPSLAMQTRREKWVIASINSVSSRDSELLPHQIEKIEQNFIAFAADVIGFLGAMFGGTSMLLDDDTGRRLAMVTASCYILSSLARLFKLSATVMSSSQDNYKKLISTLFVLPSMIKDHGPRIINSLNQE